MSRFYRTRGHATRRSLKVNPARWMVLLSRGTEMLVGSSGHDRKEDVTSWYHADLQAECVLQTEDAYADYARRHGVRPLYPTLADYPAPRDD